MKKVVLKKTVVASLSKDSMNALRGGVIEYGVQSALCYTRKITCNETAHCVSETRIECVGPGVTQDCFPDTMTCKTGVGPV